jgi:uncharacterized protein (DUF2141 family)
MSKVSRAVLMLLLCAVQAPVVGEAAPVGPFATACSGAEPAMLVRVTGFKTRTGLVRVQSYGGDPSAYFEKGTYLKRIDVHVPPSGPLEVCVPVPNPGQYAVSVKHDVNGSGRTERIDGGGMSGNPHLSLFDLMFKRKPAPEIVAIPVGHGVRLVPVTLNYLQGGSFRPVAAEG